MKTKRPVSTPDLTVVTLALAVVLAGALAAGPALAQKAYSGSAKGNLVVNGEAIPLKYAYVIEVDNVEEAGLRLGGPRKYQVMVFSDRVLPLSSVGNRNAPHAERRSPADFFDPAHKSVADAMHGIMLRYDAQQRKVFEARLLYPGQGMEFSIGGMEYTDRLSGLKKAGGFLSGTAQRAASQGQLTGGAKKYHYRVTFRAPVLAEAPLKAQWEGKAALASPPVQAIREYMEAAQKSDLAALRRLTAKSHLHYLDYPDVLKSLRKGAASKLEEQVKRVVVRGDTTRGETATVVVVSEEPNYSQTSLSLIREADAWKFCWP